MNFMKVLVKTVPDWLSLRSLSIRRKTKRLVLLSLFIITGTFLSGCNSDGNYFYEIVYPSGNRVGVESHFYKIRPVEGSSYYLNVDGEGYKFDLQLLDEEEQTIAVYKKMPGICRGEMDDDGDVWLCGERWNTNYSKGYVDSKLLFTKILKVNPLTGETLFEAKTGENEFYLTSRDDKAYFYDRGKESEERLFGLIKTEPRNAEIFYRTLDDWDTRKSVHIFSYIGRPDLGEGVTGVTNTLNFYLYQDTIQAVMETYALVEEEWKDVEKWSVEIPME